MTRRRGFIAGAALAVLAGPRSAWSAASAPGQDTGPAWRVKIATIPGPQAVLLDRARELALARGLELQIDVRPDGRGINGEVARGSLDAAAFQDGVRFEDERRRGDGALAVAAATFTLPMGLYSRIRATPRQLRDGDAVAIPADAEGRARALVLLQNFGLIELRDDIGLHATLGDVVANPRSLRLSAIPAPRLYDALVRVAAVAMDFADATRAGLEPARDSIGIEDARTPFGGVLCVRRDRLGEPWVRPLVEVLHGEEMKRFLLDRFHDSVRRPW